MTTECKLCGATYPSRLDMFHECSPHAACDARIAELEAERDESYSLKMDAIRRSNDLRDQVTHLRAALERIASATGWHEGDEDENCFDIARAALGATE